MLLKANTRQMFIDLGYESKACDKLKNDNRDDEFLVSRIIFLTTYGSNVNIEKLIDRYHLAQNICVNISRHARLLVTKQKKVKELDPMEDMALVESLKLLFNVTNSCPQRSIAFSPALPHILLILQRRPISSSKPLEPPLGPLVNSLINMPLETEDSVSRLFPRDTPYINVDRLLEILGKGTKAYTTDDDLKQFISPLVALIWKVYEIAPNDVQRHMRNVVLPSDEDRRQVLGRADSLSSRLLSLMTSVSTPSLREPISSLLFEMSGKDARAFVQNVGYGFASGFLFQHNVPIPENALEAWSTSGSEGSGASAENRISQESGKSKESWKPMIGGGDVNPVTGQRREFETAVEELEMTQEEKEREAEKLFVLFERFVLLLTKTVPLSCQHFASRF